MKHKLTDKQFEVMQAAVRAAVTRDPSTFTWWIDNSRTVTAAGRADYLHISQPDDSGIVRAVTTKTGREALADEEARRV